MIDIESAARLYRLLVLLSQFLEEVLLVSIWQELLALFKMPLESDVFLRRVNGADRHGRTRSLIINHLLLLPLRFLVFLQLIGETQIVSGIKTTTTYDLGVLISSLLDLLQVILFLVTIEIHVAFFVLNRASLRLPSDHLVVHRRH